MILWLTTLDENGCVAPLLDKEGPGVVDRWATTPYPLLFRGRGAIFVAARNLALILSSSPLAAERAVLRFRGQNRIDHHATGSRRRVRGRRPLPR
jgi:hypothetical protein